MLGKTDSFSNYNMANEEQKWEKLKKNYGYFNYKANELGENLVNDLRIQKRIRNL